MITESINQSVLFLRKIVEFLKTLRLALCCIVTKELIPLK